MMQMMQMILRPINPPLTHFGYLAIVEDLKPPPLDTSTFHDIILYHIHSHGILRPTFNGERNKDERELELEDVGLM